MSHASPLRAVVLDWGGVLQRTEDPAPRRRLDALLGLPPGGVERAVFESHLWRLASVGACSADRAWEEITRAVGYPGEVRAFVEAFFAGDRVDRRLLELVRRLRERGLKVGLLSNAPPPRKADDSPAGRWGMAELFDAQVFSYEVGALKPDPRPYRAILAALGVEAAETLFIDDAPANVAGARAVGMRVHLFRGVEELLRELESLLPQ